MEGQSRHDESRSRLLSRFDEEVDQSRAARDHKAQSLGLKRFGDRLSRVYVEASHPDDVLPSTFWTAEKSSDGDVEMKRHEINLPIISLDRLIDAIESANCLYTMSGLMNAMAAGRYGTEGLINFLRNGRKESNG